MGKLLRVLIVEDSEEDALLLLRELRRGGYEVEFERVETAEAMQTALIQKTWDLILSDYSLPEFNAPQALEVMKASGLDLPFIIMSGTIGEDTAVAALKAGAHDFLVKGKFSRLGPAIERELREAETRRDQRQAEAQLKYHARLLRHINDAVIATDDQLRITAWNRAAERMYGWSSEEVIGHNISEILSSKLTDEQRAEARERLKESIASRGERTYHRKDGKIIYVETNTIALTDAHGKMTGYVSVDRDITERKRAEEQLNYQAHLLSNVNDAIIASDENYRITFWNHAAESLYGWRADEVIGKVGPDTTQTAFPDADADDRLHHIRETGFWRGEVTQVKKDGSRFPCEISTLLLRDRTGRITGYVSINRDITERKQAEARTQLQLQRLKALRVIDIAISSSFDIRVTLDVVLQQVLSQLSVDAATILLLIPQMQTIEYAASRGFRSNAFEHTQLKLSEGYAGRVMRERKTIHIPGLPGAGGERTEAVQLAGEDFVDYYGTPLIVKGEIKGVLEIYQRSPLSPDPEWLDFLETLAGEVTIAIDNAQLFEHLQRANAELEQRVTLRTEELNQTNLELEHANRAKDEFLATMSHELRTPLNSILGLSETLLEQRRDPLSEHQQKSLRIIASSGNHLLELINDILDLSRIEAGKFDYYPQIITVDEVCRASLSFVKEQATRKSISVTYQKETSIVKVYADLRRLKQILVNLLTNAVKFTSNHGQVILQVRADAEQDRIQFAVIDSGIGIALEDLKRLFVPFSQVDSGLTREYEGTGLGLALVQKLTDLHGGSVNVESEVGKGSRFIINLPMGQAMVAQKKVSEFGSKFLLSEQAEKSNIPAHETGDRGIILLAEDNMANVLTIGDYLQSHGYQIVVAHDGLEAIEKAEEVHPNIILMDIQMPVLDGLAAIRRLRVMSRFASTPIIALTALAMPGDRERCLEAGANEYMSKPVSLKLLVKTIKQLLSKEE